MYTVNQNSRPQASSQAPQQAFVDSSRGVDLPDRPSKSKKFKKMNVKTLSATLAVLTGLLIILVVVALLIYKSNSESSYVNTSTYQSVDVRVSASTGDQVYFGKIASMNSNYMVLNDVFYLQPGATSNQFNLNSLTCTLSDPENQIIINRAQVVLWENLSSKSQVVTDIAKWHADNLQCSKSTTPTSSTTSSTTSPTSSTTSTTPTTSSTSSTTTPATTSSTTAKKP